MFFSCNLIKFYINSKYTLKANNNNNNNNNNNTNNNNNNDNNNNNHHNHNNNNSNKNINNNNNNNKNKNKNININNKIIIFYEYIKAKSTENQVERNIAKDNKIKDIRNLFTLKKYKGKSIKDKIIRNTRTLFV